MKRHEFKDYTPQHWGKKITTAKYVMHSLTLSTAFVDIFFMVFFVSDSLVNIPFPCPCSSVLLQHIITMATAHLIIASQVYCVRFDQILYTQIMFHHMSSHSSQFGFVLTNLNTPVFYSHVLILNLFLLLKTQNSKD